MVKPSSYVFRKIQQISIIQQQNVSKKDKPENICFCNSVLKLTFPLLESYFFVNYTINYSFSPSIHVSRLAFFSDTDTFNTDYNIFSYKHNVSWRRIGGLNDRLVCVANAVGLACVDPNSWVEKDDFAGDGVHLIGRGKRSWEPIC
jgi:hypothetical protein